MSVKIPLINPRTGARTVLTIDAPVVHQKYTCAAVGVTVSVTVGTPQLTIVAPVALTASSLQAQRPKVDTTPVFTKH